MKVITNLKVRPYECDSYNHVNNAVYLNYLETARMDFLEKIGFKYDELFNAGYYLFVTHVDIHYKVSAKMHEELEIQTKPVKMGAVSGTMHQIIKKPDGQISAEADITWACVNKEAKPSKIPQEFMVEGLIPEKE
ncbi:acyl-CoA thioesterase [Treponema pectinovorum]|uniref:acyl-CoA thioesterase n=1 Tax=Treponema pectinovorum TaxID=164 RepID=UPI0011C7E09A|nr:acyl-CoA thioesterase [Treponema pectinovorum]